jgi:hypothetical protein
MSTVVAVGLSPIAGRSDMTPSKPIIPHGYCQCGCGQKTNLKIYNDRVRGFIKNEPFRYIAGHNFRTFRFPNRKETINGVPCVWIHLGGFKWTVLWESDLPLVESVSWGFDGKYARQPDGAKLRMHQVLFPCVDGLEADHQDGDELNNRRSNLRSATSSQQKMNRGKNRNGASPRKGVYWHKKAGKWMVSVGLEYRSIYIGLYDNLDEAIAARKDAERTYFGEFAR